MSVEGDVMRKEGKKQTTRYRIAEQVRILTAKPAHNANKHEIAIHRAANGLYKLLTTKE